MIANSHEELLKYYKSELTYLRRMGSVFAERYPKVAKRLELGHDECSDPHVERLIEAFAFLTGRLQHEIDSEFPDITSALLNILYPQLTSPIPSMAIAQFNVAQDQGKLTTGFTIDRHTSLFADAANGVFCRFRSCYPVTLWPLRVDRAAIESTSRWSFIDADSKAVAALRLKLECFPGGKLNELPVDRLRFYLHGDRMSVKTLYELLFCDVHDVVLEIPGATSPIYLRPNAIQPVGLEAYDDMLPHPPNVHPGYMLLLEYFAFPKQYLFFDLCFDQFSRDRKGTTNTLADFLPAGSDADSIYVSVLLNRRPTDNLVVDESTFRLGCTPIINLFPKTTEPIRLDHTSLEYPLIPDKRRERTTEIHSILSVSASSNDADTTQRIEPFYSYNHRLESSHHKAFWHARRVPAQRKDLPGSEIVLSFLDLDLNPSLPPMQTVYAHTLCTNRELATELSAGAVLQMEQQAPLDKERPIVCLGKPTRPVPPPSRGATAWRLISHLSLNHLSLSEEKDSLPALKEILRLYCLSESHHQLIEGLKEMSCRKVMRHVGADPWRGFCRGNEVTLTLDEDYYEGSGGYLFGAVLNRFLASYAAINSFTQVVIKSKQREGIWKKWEPMAGESILL